MGLLQRPSELQKFAPYKLWTIGTYRDHDDFVQLSLAKRSKTKDKYCNLKSKQRLKIIPKMLFYAIAYV